MACRSAIVLAVLLAGVATHAQSVVDPALEVETWVEGLARPTTMAFIGPDDLLVLQKQDGRVRRVLDGELQPGEVLDVAVNFLLERGLLGIAIDPGFINNGHVFLFYTESSTGVDTDDDSEPLGNRVYRYTWDGDALVDPRMILDLPVSERGAHNGGVMAFGPDDKLHLVIGDVSRGNSEQSATRLQNNADGGEPDDTGVIFRVNVDGSGVVDNPFRDPADVSDPLNRYFAYGIRNSFGLAFDPVGGALWATENGPTVYDEINRVVRGFNSGHNKLWGPDERDPQTTDDLWAHPQSVYRDPEFSWQVPVAPAGIAFVESPVLGCDLQHDLIVGDTSCRQLYRFELDEARESLVLESPELADRVADNLGDPCTVEQSEVIFGPGTGFGRVTDVKNGPDGRLYLVSYNQGVIRRISPKAGAVPDVDGDLVDDRCDCDASDASAFSVPGEVPRLRVSGRAPTQLGWDSQRPTAGSGTVYTVVSGELSDLRDSDGFEGACRLVATGLPAASDSRAHPPSGRGIYFLVRAGNGCGDGPYGAPDARVIGDTLPLPDCNAAAR